MGKGKLFKLFLFLIFGIIFVPKSFALTLTHPESQHITVSEDGIFFSGKIKKHEKVYINNVLMTPEKTGAFSYSFSLDNGENIFAVQIKDLFFNTETIKYTVTKITPEQGLTFNQFIPQDASYYLTRKDNVVLRSTPVDAGMNRMGYLPKSTKLYIDGTTNEFSRVYLSKNNYGWVMTKDIQSCENTDYKPNKLLYSEQIKTDKDITYTITLSDNCPYSTTVDENKLTLTIYNLDNSDEIYTKEINLGLFPRYSIIMQNGVLYITFKNSPVTKNNYSNRKINIVIDAGHGGKESGAIGCLGDIEKNINLEVAQKLKKILEEHKFNVIMTRETDNFVTLDDRIKLAKDNNALIFLSIHMNSVPISSNPNLNQGSVVFYFNPQSKDLAKTLSKNLSQTLGTINGGATQASFAVIRPTEYIGALAELAYLINPKDVNIYKNKKFTTISAQALYKGLIEYINKELE